MTIKANELGALVTRALELGFQRVLVDTTTALAINVDGIKFRFIFDSGPAKDAVSIHPAKPPPPAAPTGADLVTWRKRRGLTERDAAMQLGVTRETLRHGERPLRRTLPLSPKLRAAFSTLAEVNRA